MKMFEEYNIKKYKGRSISINLINRRKWKKFNSISYFILYILEIRK